MKDGVPKQANFSLDFRKKWIQHAKTSRNVCIFESLV